MQTRATRTCFQVAECSLPDAKIKYFTDNGLRRHAISVKMVGFTHLWLQRFSLFRCNFVSEKNKNMMNQQTELPEKLCTDEAVCFIADRHQVTPQQLLYDFLYGDTSISLEANEIEILKGLSGYPTPATAGGIPEDQEKMAGL